MKSVLIFAGLAGIFLAAAIYYLENKGTGPGKIINVEDGFPVDA